MIEAILFDLGDTLRHFHTSSHRALVRAVVRRGHERLAEDGLTLPSPDAYARALYRQLVQGYLWSRITRRESRLKLTLSRLHRRLGIPLDDATMDRLMHAMTEAIAPYITTKPTAVQMARALTEGGVRLGIISNTMFAGHMLDEDLATEWLLTHFPVRAFSSEVGYMKPNPNIFRIALEQIAAPAERTMFVGDRMDNEVRGAARVGMTTVLFAPTGRVPRGRPKPDHVIGELRELVSIVETVNR